MATTFDVDIGKTIEQVAVHLKSVVKAPEWTLFVKTGPAKERPPVEANWFYMRTASVLRTVYVRGPIGVQKLRVKYGSKKNRGHKPEHFYKASGKIIRNILQQLEKAELVRFHKDGVHKGRVITPKGRSLVDKALKAAQ